MIDKIILEVDLLKAELIKHGQDQSYVKGCENMANSFKAILEKYRKDIN